MLINNKRKIEKINNKIISNDCFIKLYKKKKKKAVDY